ncbi:MAG: excinuclease ABC subunit UvrC [Byssovorax sp.]
MSADPTPSPPAVSPLDAKLELLPKTPGVYLFKDKQGEVLYVGKAKSLRSRVRSYFQEGGSDTRYFIPILQRIVADLETMVTATEKEAAVLENELIKQHKPRFNVKLRDDKDFLCLRLDTKAEWPRLETVRRPSPDGARYFGPYHSATSARRTLHLVNKHFQLRTCSDAELASRRRPCLQYQIKRCPAPCVKDVDHAFYTDMVRSVGLFLEGRHDELSGELDRRMREASRAMEFEMAAIYRDQLKAVTAVREEQRVVSVKDVDQDVIGLYREASLIEVLVLEVRAGRVTDSVSYPLRGVEMPDEEVLAGFLTAYYGSPDRAASLIPDEILLPLLPDGADGAAEWLGELRGKKVVLHVPQRGPKVELLAMAAENAAHAFREKLRSQDDLEGRLTEIQQRLRLPSLPHRIECCDISHLGGGDTVGSIVSLLDGQPDRKHYRSYRVKSVTDGDDYGAMYEVLARRFRRGKAARAASASPAEEPAEATVEEMEPGPELAEEGAGEGAGEAAIKPVADVDSGASSPIERAAARAETEWDLPDLFVVDGGRGQLGVALSAAQDLGLHDLPIVGLAKERETATGEKMVDRVYLPGQKNGIPLRAQSAALFFLARARDEAHRFANHIRARLGKARRLRSEIEDIPGLGAETRKALLKGLGSMEALREATDAQILAVPGVQKRHLTALRKVIAAPEPAPEGKA